MRRPRKLVESLTVIPALAIVSSASACSRPKSTARLYTVTRIADMQWQPVLSGAIPTLVGPLISALVIATVYAAFGPVEGLLGGRFSNWIFWLMITEPLALLLGILMLGLDGVWYLLTNYRPVADWRAWIAGLAGPIPVEIAWTLWRPSDVGSAFWFALLAPIVVTAMTIRLALWLSAVASG